MLHAMQRQAETVPSVISHRNLRVRVMIRPVSEKKLLSLLEAWAACGACAAWPMAFALLRENLRSMTGVSKEGARVLQSVRPLSLSLSDSLFLQLY